MNQLLAKLSVAVNQTSSDVRDVLESNLIHLMKYQNALTEGSREIMLGLQNSWNKEIDSLKNEAKKKNIDISVCLGSDEATLLKEYQTHYDNVTTCFQSFAERASSSAQTVYNVVSLFSVY